MDMVQEKKAMKEEKLKLEEKYMWAVVDGVKEKVDLPIALSLSPKQSSSLKLMFIFQVGNFRVEPPGLFRGRGEHPKVSPVSQRLIFANNIP